MTSEAFGFSEHKSSVWGEIFRTGQNQHHELNLRRVSPSFFVSVDLRNITSRDLIQSKVSAEGVCFSTPVTPAGAMSGLRKHFTMGLVLLLCALTGHCGESAPTPAPAAHAAAAAADGDAQQDFRRMVEIVRRVEDSRGHHGTRTGASLASQTRSVALEQRDFSNLRTERGNLSVAVYPRDLRKKEKFLKHITGPLYFSPKCRKNVYRVYHHTRDCTIPAYFKRCARLLTRLAGSPQCTEG